MVAHINRKRFGSSGLLVACFAVLLASACAEPHEPALVGDADMIATGRIAYLTFCLNCHGDSGLGDGPLMDLIAIDPGDITQLSAAHEGVYPAAFVAEVIRGTDQEIAGHVSREMPVWYTVWSEQFEGPNKEATIERQIQELVAYLETIQK